MKFEILKNSDADKVAPFYGMRPDRTCDSGMLDTFIWRDYCDIRYCIVEDRALLLLMREGQDYYAALPYCREQDLQRYFLMLQDFFNEQLHRPFKIYLADEEGVEVLGLKENTDYMVEEEDDLKDYIYDGERMRTLAGKKLQSKRNQINKFKRDFEGRWEYRSLSGKDYQIIVEFLEKWFAQKLPEEKESHTLLSEKQGILAILKDYGLLAYHMGGIFIDGNLEAFSIGTRNDRHNMAIINVEKANAEFPGIYQMINQQFLLHEFPDAAYVNREDDMGLPGLRKAKSSYHPVDFARKYMVIQRNYPGAETDSYESAGQEHNSGIRVLEILEEKQHTRGLYEKIFSDSKDYVDYYYQEKCRDNRILVKEYDEKVFAMVHLNPYILTIRGREAKTYCIAAVATLPEYRHRGFMTELLEYAFYLMEQERIPFCYLIPVDETIYSGMGFEPICSLFTEEQPEDTICREYDIYPKQDAVYEFRKELEGKLDCTGGEELPEHPVVMARVIDRKAFDALMDVDRVLAEGEISGDRAELTIQEVIQKGDCADSWRLDWLRKQKIYICDEV